MTLLFLGCAVPFLWVCFNAIFPPLVHFLCYRKCNRLYSVNAAQKRALKFSFSKMQPNRIWRTFGGSNDAKKRNKQTNKQATSMQRFCLQFVAALAFDCFKLERLFLFSHFFIPPFFMFNKWLRQEDLHTVLKREECPEEEKGRCALENMKIFTNYIQTSRSSIYDDQKTQF